jgi:predicted ATPase
MITQFSLQNFKAFKDLTTIDFGQLTILSGMNSSGKSSIYQGLLLLMQSRDSKIQINNVQIPTLKVNGEYVTIGTRKELLNDPYCDTVYFDLKWSGEEEVIKLKYKYVEITESSSEFLLSNIEYKYENGSNISLSLNLNDYTWELTANTALGFDNSTFGSTLETYLKETERDSERIFRSIVSFKGITNLEFNGLALTAFDIKIDDVRECIHQDIKNFKIDDIKVLYEVHILNGDSEKAKTVKLRNNSGEGKIVRFLKSGLVEIPPFRGVPQRIYNESNHPNPLHGYFLNKHEKIQYYFDIKTNEVKSGSTEEALNFWVSEQFELADKVHVREILADYSTEILLEIQGKEIPINNMGFGVSQILPIIFRLLTEDEQKFIVVDEPEIHLHPSAQSKLADFFFQMSLIKKTIFIETHSEVLITRMIYNLITTSSPENIVQMLWTERINGKSDVRKIEFDQLGFLLNPPKGFMDTRTQMNDELKKFRVNSLSKK